MPLLSPPPPPLPARAPGRGRQRRLSHSRRRRRSKRTAERINWAELPLDALLHVLHRLDHVDLIFGGAAKVCRSWRAAAREPELWRRIDMRGHSRLFKDTISLDRMARLSIWFSAGQCESFFGEEDVHDGLLLFLADEAPLLKSLHLTDCCDVTSEAFIEAITKFPLLEELEICRCYNIYDMQVFEVAATACPGLKHFKHVEDERYVKHHSVVYPANRNDGAMAIARMHELRSLQLFRCSLNNQGLATILDNCHYLESLDIRNCKKIRGMDSSLRAKCARVKTKKLYPYAFTDDWEHFRSSSDDDFTDHSEYFEPGSPVSDCSKCCTHCWHDGDERDCHFLFIEPDDSDDSDHSRYFSGADETEFEEHDRIIPKGMRRCLRI